MKYFGSVCYLKTILQQYFFQDLFFCTSIYVSKIKTFQQVYLKTLLHCISLCGLCNEYKSTLLHVFRRNKFHCNVAYVCSWYDACPDWLILGYYSPVIPKGWLEACKNLLTSNIWSLQKNLKTRPYCVDLAITQSIWQGLGLRFSYKELTFG